MNDRKMRQLLSRTALESPPAPPADFAAHVITAARREPAAIAPMGMANQLTLLFPRLAIVMLVVFALCLAADLGHALLPGPDLTDGVLLLYSQWDFPTPRF